MPITIHLRHPDADRHIADLSAEGRGAHALAKTRCGIGVARAVTVVTWWSLVDERPFRELARTGLLCRRCEGREHAARAVIDAVGFAPYPAIEPRGWVRRCDSGIRGERCYRDAGHDGIHRAGHASWSTYAAEAAARSTTGRLTPPAFTEANDPTGERQHADDPTDLLDEDAPTTPMRYAEVIEVDVKSAVGAYHVGTLLGHDLWLATGDDDTARRAAEMLRAMAKRSRDPMPPTDANLYPLPVGTRARVGAKPTYRYSMGRAGAALREGMLVTVAELSDDGNVWVRREGGSGQFLVDPIHLRVDPAEARA